MVEAERWPQVSKGLSFLRDTNPSALWLRGCFYTHRTRDTLPSPQTPLHVPRSHSPATGKANARKLQMKLQILRAPHQRLIFLKTAKKRDSKVLKNNGQTFQQVVLGCFSPLAPYNYYSQYSQRTKQSSRAQTSAEGHPLSNSTRAIAAEPRQSRVTPSHLPPHEGPSWSPALTRTPGRNGHTGSPTYRLRSGRRNRWETTAPGSPNPRDRESDPAGPSPGFESAPLPAGSQLVPTVGHGYLLAPSFDASLGTCCWPPRERRGLQKSPRPPQGGHWAALISAPPQPAAGMQPQPSHLLLPLKILLISLPPQVASPFVYCQSELRYSLRYSYLARGWPQACWDATRSSQSTQSLLLAGAPA